MEFIEKEVVPKINIMREKKTNEDLLLDLRFSNKYSGFLISRISNMSHFQRLGLDQ
jgi:hypothetical protein